MENAERSGEPADVESILKALDSWSSCMDQLALRTQLRRCDLIVRVGRPDKPALPENPRPPTPPEAEA